MFSILLVLLLLGIVGYVIGKEPILADDNHRQGKCE
jgi:hypothetical protein